MRWSCTDANVGGGRPLGFRYIGRVSETKPILILGAGINGAALARELALSGVSVCVVDRDDLSSGTTARSSRLIHGGLRYLEYGEFDLVKESLEERTRLLRLAPQFVRPLRIYIPVTSRFGGLWASARRFLGFEGRRSAITEPSRSVWLVKLGLRFYDAYARDPTLPRHRVHRLDDPAAPTVDRNHYGWMCSYYDAQIRFPERFVVALFEDARRAAAERGTSFELYTYHEARRHGGEVELRRRDGETPAREPVRVLEPAAIINATGAWVDQTLRQLDVASRRLIGGTQGSHFLTYHQGLRHALGGQAIYGEAIDGRPIFMLPFGSATLVGTTDISYEGDPRDATASPEELQYLIDSVNYVVPALRLSIDEVDCHYSGVRPLPSTQGQTAASITRRHWLEYHAACVIPVFSVIGGKLTTCRSLAEEAASEILGHLEQQVIADSRERSIPGGENYPADDDALETMTHSLAERFKLSLDQVSCLWALFGTRSSDVLEASGNMADGDLQGTHLPRSVVRWIIRHEWVETIPDLVERRLMLIFHHGLTIGALGELADLLVEAGKLETSETKIAVQSAAQRLRERFGKRLLP